MCDVIYRASRCARAQGDWRYNTAKFLRRHFLAASATGAVFLGLVVIAGVTLWQNHRISIARDATAQERDRAQQVSAFLVDVFSQADPFNAQGNEPPPKTCSTAAPSRSAGTRTCSPKCARNCSRSIGFAYRRLAHSELCDTAVRSKYWQSRKDQRPLDKGLVALALANLAQALTDAGRFGIRREDIKEAFGLVAGRRCDFHARTADILAQYGNLYLSGEKRSRSGRGDFKRALSIYRGLPDQSLAIARMLTQLAAASVWTGRV